MVGPVLPPDGQPLVEISAAAHRLSPAAAATAAKIARAAAVPPPGSPAPMPPATGRPPVIHMDALNAGLGRALETSQKSIYTDPGEATPIKTLALEYVEDALFSMRPSPPCGPRPYLRLKVDGEMYDVEQRNDTIRVFGPGGNRQEVILRVLKEVQQENAQRNVPVFDPARLAGFLSSAKKRPQIVGFSPDDQRRALALARLAMYESGFVDEIGKQTKRGYKRAQRAVDGFFEREKTCMAATRILHLDGRAGKGRDILPKKHRHAFAKIIHRIYMQKP